MTDTGKQNKANGQQKADPEAGSSGEPDLESLLAEYEKGSEEEKPPKEYRPEDIRALADAVRSEQQVKADTRQREDIGKAMKWVAQADSLRDFPEKLLMGMAQAYALDNPAFAKAFEGRTQRPQVWQAALSEFQKSAIEMAKEIPNGRSDLEAAKAAVAGSSDETPRDDGPSVDDLVAMSDVAFQQYTQKLLRKS